MNIENFKSIVLINLIVISLFLTFNLWTYVPETSSSSEAKYVQDNEEIGETEISDVIFPSSFIAKKDNKSNTHLIVKDKEAIKVLYEVLKEGEFHHFREIGKEKQDFLSFVNDEDKIEFVFPTAVPFDSIRSGFNLKEKNLEGYSFNRILVDLAASTDDDIKTYFILDETKKIYEMTLTGVALTQITNKLQAILPKAERYSMYTLESGRFFLPNAPTTMKEIEYFISSQDPLTFKNVLFTDPRYVKEIKGESENTYTDGTRLMKVLKENHMLQYTNSSVDDKRGLSGNILVQRSFDFINSHNGFPNDALNDYRLDDMNAGEGEITFRRYKDNKPVFNSNGMSKLEQVWGTDLISYQRPLFKVTHDIHESSNVTLPRGNDVIESLQKKPQISLKRVKNIGIGYKLVPGSEANDGKSIVTIRLIPIWYVVYGDAHQVFEWKEGGELVGLE
ncbi:hypothetical protein BAMA_12765 [Bacillus manliponensis]|uniref:Regulatory protein YycH domain-containing protein n=1 Tax=Bacillus manliponensis TaxID=574376 RepID=A0A073JTE5_9BACI|nr:two-component system activity regulator YycH [Bacillus manliponensis]KEK17502.1 hypothetical protein BAMA_12765 [Bacillus manliponensis]